MEWMDAQVPFSCSPSDLNFWPAESNFCGGQLGVPPKNSSKQIFCSCSEARDESIEPPVLTTLRSWKSSVELNSQQKEDYSYCEDKKPDVNHVPSSTQSAAAGATPSFLQGDIVQSNQCETGISLIGFTENSVEQKYRACETEYQENGFRRDCFQASTPYVAQNQDLSAARYSDMAHPQLIQLGSPCDADRRKSNRLDGVAAHGVPQTFQTISAPQHFPISYRTPAESSLSVSPFQIFSTHPSKICSEHAPPGTNERAIRASNAYMAPLDDAAASSSSTGEAEAKFIQTDPACFLKQPRMPVRQNQFNAMQVQNSDVQHFLFTQTKTRQRRSTSIRIIEYNDIEHCPYQQGVIQDNKASDAMAAQPTASPFVNANEGNYQQLTTADIFGSCIENTQTCKQSASADGNLFAISDAKPRMGSASDSYPGYSHLHHSLEEFDRANTRPQTSRTATTNENAGNYAVAKEAPPVVFQEHPFHSFHSDDAYGDRFGFAKTPSRLPPPQNPSFLLSHGSLFCGQMKAAGTSIKQERITDAPASSWNENRSRQGYSFDSYGMMDLNPTCRGNIGTYNMSRSEVLTGPKQNKVSFRTKSKDQKKRRFVCTYLNCSKKYFKQAHLEMHLRKHAGERPYPCTFKDCDRRFKRSDQLKRHGRCHTREKPYSCLECGKCFARSDHLKIHRKTHIGNIHREDRGTCSTSRSICAFRFPCLREIKHSKSTTASPRWTPSNAPHGDSNDKPYSCCWVDCKKKFAHHDDLCRHQISHHNAKMKSCFPKNQNILLSVESPSTCI